MSLILERYGMKHLIDKELSDSFLEIGKSNEIISQVKKY